MAISAIPPVSTFSGVAAVSALAARNRTAVADQAPLVATPSVIVTLGTNTSVPLLYNPAGLLQSLFALDATNALPSGPAPGSAEARLQQDLRTVLGLDTDATGTGILDDATGSLPNLSADAAQALSSVLANATNGAEAGDRNQALSDLLAQARSVASSGLGSATAAANVLNAAGIFQGSAADVTFRAAENLQTLNLGLAATALDTNTSNAAALATPGLLQSTRNGDTGSAFDNLLAANVGFATAGLNAQDNRNSDTAVDALTNVLLSRLNLSGAATGLGTGTDGNGAVAATALLPPSVAAGTATQAPIGLPAGANANNAATAGITASATSATPTIAAARVPISPGVTAPTVGAPLTAPIDSATARLQTLLNDPATRAIATVTRDPAYAAAAAALYLSAAVYRFQTPANIAGAGAVPERTVTAIQSIRALKAV